MAARLGADARYLSKGDDAGSDGDAGRPRMTGKCCRVLYLNHAAKPSGAEMALWRMLGAIDRERVEPIILFGDDGIAADLMREIGIETHVMPLDGTIREVRKDTLDLLGFIDVRRIAAVTAYAARVARFARQQGVQIIHTNTIKAHFYGALAGWMAGLPVVWHVRDYVNESYLPQAAVKLVRFLARCAPRHIIGVSRSVLEQLQLGTGGTKSTVILDGLTERELTREARPKPVRAPGSRARIGIVGRLARWKGQHVFIAAASKVVAAGFDVEFGIIGAALFGEEKYEEELRRQTSALGLDGRMQFRGFTRDVAGELDQLDILVHASTTGEPFGQVIVEGMAAGLPVVASRGGGVPEIITHGENGLLTPMGDADALAAAMMLLLREPETAQRLGRAGYEHARKDFRAERGARQVEGVYHGLDRGGLIAPAAAA